MGKEKNNVYLQSIYEIFTGYLQDKYGRSTDEIRKKYGRNAINILMLFTFEPSIRT
jgi:hypothetical protein